MSAATVTSIDTHEPISLPATEVPLRTVAALASRRCDHRKINGIRCGSPALREGQFCFFHERVHGHRVEDLEFCEDANSIAFAINDILKSLNTGFMDVRFACAM